MTDERRRSLKEPSSNQSTGHSADDEQHGPDQPDEGARPRGEVTQAETNRELDPPA